MEASRYADLLSEADLVVLGRASRHRAEPDAAAWFRADPRRIAAALDAAATYDSLFAARPRPDGIRGPGPAHAGDNDSQALETVTPLLVFAVLVHRASADIAGHAHLPERLGGRLQVPVFDGGRLAAYAASPTVRLLLVELLGSYTRVASGPQWELSRGRWRRRRFSEMNPAHLARLAAGLPAEERAGAYRRLGDLALFLNGVFPDHAARDRLAPIDVERIMRSLPDHARRDIVRLAPDQLDATGPLLAALGPRWYRLAADLVPIPDMRAQLADLGEHFEQARRFLNFVTDRYLWTRRDRLFPWA